jgi:hypothetical protein
MNSEDESNLQDIVVAWLKEELNEVSAMSINNMILSDKLLIKMESLLTKENLDSIHEEFDYLLPFFRSRHRVILAESPEQSLTEHAKEWEICVLDIGNFPYIKERMGSIKDKTKWYWLPRNIPFPSFVWGCFFSIVIGILIGTFVFYDTPSQQVSPRSNLREELKDTMQSQD